MLKRCCNGFQNHGRLHQFKSLILYSTSSAAKNGIPIPIPNPLISEEDEAVSTVTNCKVSHPFKSTLNSQLVVEFLKNSGFHETHIRKVVIGNPIVLRNKVDKTLMPKIRVFQELGLSVSDLGLIISRHPRVLNRSLKSCISPVLNMLKSVVGSNEQLVRVLLQGKSKLLFSSHALKNLPINVLLLQSYGITNEGIEILLIQRPTLLLQHPQRVEAIINGVEENLGIPRTSGMFVHGVCALNMRSEDNIKLWRGVFLSYGWSETQISVLLNKLPLLLSQSENSLRSKLEYLMKGLGYGSDYLATRPSFLSLSIEKRIVPRAAVMKVLQEKQMLKLDACFYSFVCKAESKFVERYVVPLKEKLPEIYEYYMQATSGGSLSKAVCSRLVV